MRKSNHRLWTMEEMEHMSNLWTSLSTNDIAMKLGRSPAVISQMAAKLRAAGLDLPKKRKNAYIDKLVKEFVANVKSRSKK